MPFPHSSSRTLRHKLILAGIMVPLFMLVVIVLLVVLIPGRKEVPSSETLLEWKGKGTTKHLREIILGRCYNYLATMNSELRDKDCLKIWELLENAFMYKNPCSMTEEDYQPLMDLARHSVPCNKSLFWSKTNDLVHRYTKANQDFVTLEDTLLGYIADGISWCGNPTSPGVNYNSCPKWTECESNPSSVYWKMASKMFAEAACGTVQVMLNGSIEAGAFRSNSIFGNVEILNLNPDKVSRMHIWLMHDIDGPQSEFCTGHSITKLKEILESRKISVYCEDNYRPVQLLQCTTNPDHTTCKACS
ncbi:ADP-ribosyl cyclase/cyclic ADP-ribose hydrolase 1 [Sceloporus undulatus]|uniref:ADP-ribosyl cyclase/cyclic ADP-ribose hydrolase 1 n=1 Tax=Sceloporus undulatus TaxID=8520 RepID=UPI001C4DBD23|nr:ADP-ribosyl cyclase/cyclic ADP-ribose hydrolase 1 [Sceloporus undulatus]